MTTLAALRAELKAVKDELEDSKRKAEEEMAMNNKKMKTADARLNKCAVWQRQLTKTIHQLTTHLLNPSETKQLLEEQKNQEADTKRQAKMSGE